MLEGLYYFVSIVYMLIGLYTMFVQIRREDR